MNSHTTNAYDCDEQYPENPVLRCSLDAKHAGRHEAWTDDTPRAPRLLASWDRSCDLCSAPNTEVGAVHKACVDRENADYEHVIAGLGDFNRAMGPR